MLSNKRLSFVLISCLSVFMLPRVAWGTDCNINGIDDACDIDCGEPGGPCYVPNCGNSEDCNSNGIPDECEISTLFAGTQGGGVTGVGKVFKYEGGSSWPSFAEIFHFCRKSVHGCYTDGTDSKKSKQICLDNHQFMWYYKSHKQKSIHSGKSCTISPSARK